MEFDKRITVGNIVNLGAFVLMATVAIAQRNTDLDAIKLDNKKMDARIVVIENEVGEAALVRARLDEGIKSMLRQLDRVESDLKYLRERSK